MLLLFSCGAIYFGPILMQLASCESFSSVWERINIYFTHIKLENQKLVPFIAELVRTSSLFAPHITDTEALHFKK